MKKAAGAKLRIALDPGEYEVLRVDGDRGWAGDVSIGAAREVTLDLTQLVPRALDRHARKGGEVPATFGALAAYHVSTGWLDDAAPSHGVRLGAVRETTEPLELSVFAEYAESRYRRSDEVSVVLRQVGGGGAAMWGWPVARSVRLLGGVEVGVME